MQAEIITVGTLSQRVKDSLQQSFRSPVWVTGEVSSFKKHNSRLFLNLVERKDSSALPTASLSCQVSQAAADILRRKLKDSRLKLQDGVPVMLLCRVTMYTPRGDLQLDVLDIDPEYTVGKTTVSKEAVLQQLKSEGLLHLQQELALPSPCLRVALLTSPGSNAQADFETQLHASKFRFQITTFPCLVQGATAPQSVLGALRAVTASPIAFDVVCLVRGGGSRTDLAAWDDIEIARAVARFAIPVMCGIGHELDRSVADEVVLRSAKTPTALAQSLIDDAAALHSHTEELFTRFATLASHTTSARLSELHNVPPRVRQSLSRRCAAEAERLDVLLPRAHRVLAKFLKEQLAAAATALPNVARLSRAAVRNEETFLNSSSQLLSHTSLEATLSRGFSITRTQTGAVLTGTSELVPGEVLVTLTKNGTVTSEVLHESSKGKQYGSSSS